MEPRRTVSSNRAPFRCLLCLFVCIVLTWVNITPEDLAIVSDLLHNGDRQPCTATLVLFGVPKSFGVIWKQYQKNLILNNPHVNFSVVSMHLYNDIRFLDNAKNNEKLVPIESAERINHILQSHYEHNKTRINLQRGVITETSQQEFDQQKLDPWLRDEHAEAFDPCCWTKDTLKNMFRQGNSIQQSFDHAQKLLQQQQQDESLYVFARSDTFLARPVALSCSMPSNQLWLPSWQIHPENEHNDRFAVAGGAKAAQIYVQAKADAFFRYVQDPAAAVSPIQVQKWNSEHMLWLWLQEQKVVDVIAQDKAWAPLLRIRGGQKVNSRDMWTFPRGYIDFQRQRRRSRTKRR